MGTYGRADLQNKMQHVCMGNARPVFKRRSDKCRFFWLGEKKKVISLRCANTLHQSLRRETERGRLREGLRLQLTFLDVNETINPTNSGSCTRARIQNQPALLRQLLRASSAARKGAALHKHFPVFFNQTAGIH